MMSDYALDCLEEENILLDFRYQELQFGNS
jgi:hypothetical protein